MAVLFTTIKNTNQEVVIHFDTVLAESGEINIANLGASTQSRNSDAPAVNDPKTEASPSKYGQRRNVIDSDLPQ